LSLLQKSVARNRHSYYQRTIKRAI